MTFENKIVSIIVPHIDDDIYSCSSVILKCIKERSRELNVFYASKGERQTARKQSLSHIYSEIFGSSNDVRTHLDLFEDGNSDDGEMQYYVQIIDKIIERSHIVLIPSISHHQDHIGLNVACMAALRYRESLHNLEMVLEYEYQYNHESTDSEVYVEIQPIDYDKKLGALQYMDKFDKILAESSVNSLEYVNLMDRMNGLRSNNQFAERFKVRYLKM